MSSFPTRESHEWRLETERGLAPAPWKYWTGDFLSCPGLIAGQQSPTGASMSFLRKKLQLFGLPPGPRVLPASFFFLRIGQDNHIVIPCVCLSFPFVKHPCRARACRGCNYDSCFPTSGRRSGVLVHSPELQSSLCSRFAL